VPKQRKKRKPNNAAQVASTTSRGTSKWVKYSAIIVILMLMLSVLVGALASSPAKAASFTPNPSCSPIDTDGDGIYNNEDPDIDGDNIVNGKDPDIDGDGIANAQDSDPAATNCGADAPLPKLGNGIDVASPTFRISSILVILVSAVGYLLLRSRRGNNLRNGKL
jgi:hypothetical protein